MRALNRKLLRNLWTLKGQGMAIAAVIAGGVATFVMAFATIDTMRLTQELVYREYRFADVFADLKRAPNHLAERIEQIPGVTDVDTRVQAPLHVRLEDFDEPVTGRAISVPEGRQPELNRLHLLAGALPEAERDDQVVLSEAFAEEHALEPGDHISLIIDGRYQRLLISGIAVSPDYIYQLRPGDIVPDFKRYAIVWMNRRALEAASGSQGAFNQVSLALSPGTQPQQVIERLDLLLDPWGGLGAYDRGDQFSHYYLNARLDQFEAVATFLPMLFIAVAAFLLNVVCNRLIRTQRAQIAVLKAFGYSNGAVGAHYLGLMLGIVVVGSVAGILLGLWMAGGLANLYQEFFRFPWVEFRLRPPVALFAVGIAALAAALGTVSGVRAAVRLPPAEAMRPEPPANYRRTLIERLGLGRRFSQPARIVMRNIERTPVKSTLSVTGIALAVGLLVTTGFQWHAVDEMMRVQFGLAQQEDVTVNFTDARSSRVIHELASLPGVRHAEGFRSSPAILRNGHRSYRTPLQGSEPDARLSRMLDGDLNKIELPEEGVLLTDYLAELLDLSAGDTLQVEIREGRRPELDVRVAAVVSEYIGVGAYLRNDTLARLLREAPAYNGVRLSVEPDSFEVIESRLEDMPGVAGVTRRENLVETFRGIMDENLLVFALVTMILGGSIAFAVVYNNARIAFSERQQELASLRILGFTRGEISFILLGELMILTLLALLPGFLFGYGMVQLLTMALATDLFRVPAVLVPANFARAALVVLLAALVSALVVLRKVQRLDMVTALKGME